MKTKCDLKCVKSLFDLKLRQTLNRFLIAFNNPVINRLMSRFRPKPKPISGRKYSSFWFALKAIQNHKPLRNKWFDNNRELINFNLLMNGFADENCISDDMSHKNVNKNIKISDNNSDQSVKNESIQSNTNGIQIIEINAKKALVLITNRDPYYELSFGCIQLTLLSENCDLVLNGFTLSADNTIELMAAFGHRVSIKCQTNEKNINNSLSEMRKKLQTIGIQEFESVLSKLEDNSCLILIEKLCLSSLLFLQNVPNFRPSTLKSQSDWFEFRNTGNCFESIKVWEKLFKELDFNTKDVIIVCGGSNVGKSSLIRNLINRYLSGKGSEGSDTECLYLDCDPGQTEFSTSAQISLTKIQKPLLSSAAMNVMKYKPLMSSSVGANTANKEPKLYISSVSHLINHFRNNLHSKGPLFVNTMGWTRDLGLALLIDIVKITAPTHVIQIDSTVDLRINFAFDLTPESVHKHCGFQSNRNDSNRSLKYKLSIIGSNNRDSKIAKTNRICQQLAYVSQMAEIIFKPVFAMKPIQILWSTVYLHIISDSRLSSELFLDVLNCSWIQLCRIDEQNIKFKQQNGIRIIDSIDGNQCLGSAIVRGIDFENKCFYILSPESPEIVRSVNCIVRPTGVQIPENLILEQLNYSPVSDVPYVYNKT